jgi:hypothetical protein
MISFGEVKRQKYIPSPDQPGFIYCTEVEVEIFRRCDQIDDMTAIR